MKKFQLKKRSEEKKQAPSRITNETVAEHRERILAGGRRFKYPIQYARHRLVFNTIIVTVVALLLIVGLGWWQLYIVQNSSTFFYRVTRVLPLPVASVDGESVRYSNYLMYYNSSVHYLEKSEQVNIQSEDGKRQADYIKRKSMDNVIADAFAEKKARELKITVDESRVDKVIEDDRNTANGVISQETYDASALNVLGWTPDEYRQDARSKLIRQDVSYAIDTQAKKREEQAATLLQTTNNLDDVATKLGGDGAAKVTVGVSGLVPRSNRDGGLSTTAVSLDEEKVSGAVKTTTGDGYYFVKLLKKTDTQVSYAYLKVPLTAFSEQLAQLKKDGKIHEYITIPAVDTSATDKANKNGSSGQ
ncbi:MAG TPA: SurA N-terminal domain-containing protein [Candidatus Saccharimonadales bacterium]|nr:SurA N-terminal domain-containing protein [Candidatus Saccharimonadales bacterium]